MRSSFRKIRNVIVQIAVVGLAVHVAFGGSQGRSENASNPLAISAESVEGTPVRPLRTSIKWDGQEYRIDIAIDVLMGVVRDPEASHRERELALIHLTIAGPHLKNRECLRELETLYDKAGELQKRVIVDCFVGSRDPRAIPFLARVLEGTGLIELQLRAAAGLAGWNIRRGVAEVVKLLDSPEPMPRPSTQFFYMRDNAMRTFRLLSIRKGWGFPDDKDSAEWPPDVMPPPDVAARLRPRPTVEEIKKWWAENEHRFPDWKLGDPLPKVETAQDNPVDENDK